MVKILWMRARVQELEASGHLGKIRESSTKVMHFLVALHSPNALYLSTLNKRV